MSKENNTLRVFSYEKTPQFNLAVQLCHMRYPNF